MTSRPLRKNSHHDDDDYEEDIALTNASGGNDHYAQNVEYSRSAADGRRRTRDDHSHGDDDDYDDPDEYGSYEQGPSAGAGGGRNGASGGTTAGLMDHIQEARQREQFVQTQKKKRRYLIIGAVISSIVILAGAAVGAYFIWDKQFKDRDPTTISSAEEPQSSSKEPPSTSTPIDTSTEEEGTDVIEEAGPPPSNVTSNMTDTTQGGGNRFCALITGGTNASMPSFSIGDDYGSTTDTATSTASRFRTRLKRSEDNLQRRDLQGVEPKCHPDGITCTSDQDCVAAYGGEDGLLYASCVESCDDSGAAPSLPGVDEGTTTAGYCSGSSLDIGGSENEPEKMICHPQKIVCNTNEDCFDFSVQDPSFLDGMLFMTQLCTNECEDLEEGPSTSSSDAEQSNFTTILTLEEREECLLSLEEQDLFCEGIIVAISAAAEGGNATNSTDGSSSDVTAAVPDKCMVTTQECRARRRRRSRLLRKRNLQTTSDVEVDFQLTWDAVSDEPSSSMSKTDQFLQYTSNSNFVQDLTSYLEEGSNSTFKVVYMTFPTLLLEVDDKVTNGTLNETTALGGCGYEEETVDYYGYMNTETICLNPLVPCNTDSDCLSSAVVESSNTTVICMTSCAFNQTRLPEEYVNETDTSLLNETIVDDSTLDTDANATDTNITSLASNNETELLTDSNMTDPLLDGNVTETNVTDTTNVTDIGTNMTDMNITDTNNTTDTTNTTDMNNMTEIIPPPVAKGVCGSYRSSSSSSSASFIARQELARQRRRNLQRLRQAQDDVPLVPPSFPPPGIDLGTGLGVPLPPAPPEDYYPNATTTTSNLPAIETTSTTSLNDTTGIPPPSIGIVDEFAPVDIGIPSDESYYNLSIQTTGPLLVPNTTDSNTTLPEVSPINDDPVIVDQNVNFEANLTNTTEEENIIIDYYDDIGINDVTTTNNTNTTTNFTDVGDLICDIDMIPCVSDDECSYMDDDENIYMCLQECMDDNMTDPEVNITYPELNNTDFNNTDFNNTDFNNTDIITNVTNTTGGLLGGIVNVSQVVNEILGIFTSGNGYCGYQVAKEFVHNDDNSTNSTSGSEFDILGFFEQGVGTSTPSTSLVDNICDVSGQRCNTDEDCQVSDETLVCLERCEPPPPLDDTISTSSISTNTINSVDVGTIDTNGDETNTTSAEPVRMRCGIPVSPDLTNDESSNVVFTTDSGIAISCSTEYSNECDDDLECAFELESPIAKCVPECYALFQQ